MADPRHASRFGAARHTSRFDVARHASRFGGPGGLFVAGVLDGNEMNSTVVTMNDVAVIMNGV